VAAAALAIVYILGRVSAPTPPPTFPEVQVAPEALGPLKPKLDDSFITNLLDRTLQPSQVATAPGAEVALIERFCAPRNSEGRLPPIGGVEPPQRPVSVALAPVLYTGGKYDRTTLELFTATSRGAGQRYLFEGVHRPLEFGLDKEGRPFVETSRIWWLEPSLRVGAGSAAGAAVGGLAAGTGGSVAGAAIGAILGVLLTY